MLQSVILCFHDERLAVLQDSLMYILVPFIYYFTNIYYKF